MTKTEYRLLVRTLEGETVREEIGFDPARWPEIIRSTGDRYFYLLSLQRRLIIQGPEARQFLYDWKPDPRDYLILRPGLVVSHWKTLAEVHAGRD